MAKRSEIVGMEDLLNMVKKLEKVPQRVVNKAARAGASIARKAAKNNAPEGETGELKKGIIMRKERRVKAGKAVFDIMMDPAKSDIFAKIGKNGQRAYYPASQEYGFMTVDGGFVPGYHFLRNSLQDNATDIEKKVVEVAGKEIDKVMKGG
ncbi:MAG: HK97 gp10 family phage protein [Candidatus Cohnella colombiensis]|uniref:HK97 gp10 family phage protein n=1 Tax=Candidatus Cohnella colombiensis TaxID=3121368 RepID=A0AA95EWP6_9BACL|nr:MAG: HK97 gp10 family phage protein [Cohnella sp.]